MPHKNIQVFRLLVNKMPLKRICEAADISMSAMYGKIDFIHQQCLSFAQGMKEDFFGGCFRLKSGGGSHETGVPQWAASRLYTRFRPISSLSDGYIKQKKSQGPADYYIHEESGWTDTKIRIVGSIASDISRMARAGVKNLDAVRQYYGRPTMEETVKRAA